MSAVAKCWGCQEKILKPSSCKPLPSWGKHASDEEGGYRTKMQTLGEKNLEKQEGKCPIFLLGGKEVKLTDRKSVV